MRYTKIDNKLFKDNRLQFSKLLLNNSIAIFNSNDLMPKNADQVMTFKQNSDIFYLSGIDQEETILVIIKKNSELRELLFVRETSENLKIWEGEKLSKEKAKEVSGSDSVFWNTDFTTMLPELMNNIENIYLNSNEHPRANIVVETRDARFGKWIKSKYPKHTYKKSAELLHAIRAIKKPEEIKLIQQACDITKKGVERVCKHLRPGIFEYEIEAEIIHEFLINNSRGFAYDPIIASGDNACILHYGSNNDVCNDGDLVLMDFGAEYANYASDLTRCFPVNGRFSKRQKNVYNSVLRVMTAAKDLLKPGVFLHDYEKDVGLLMEKELIDLKLISMKDISKFNTTPAYKKYYMHGTSHHLGLDVHDVSEANKPLKEGMVLTCEPGIYIPEERLGIRLENDILITENGNIDLMSNIPIDAEEIEDMLNI
ncbi:MAG: X-Pro aminopeptidase [Flavobacteriales bacterium]|nr:X-Pro aminopeptidase [Flavobacteriales bacterium]